MPHKSQSVHPSRSSHPNIDQLKPFTFRLTTGLSDTLKTASKDFTFSIYAPFRRFEKESKTRDDRSERRAGLDTRSGQRGLGRNLLKKSIFSDRYWGINRNHPNIP
jgi:outer membrane scaffolding protein for murein synthesis (MipA/OmpV family)